MKSASTPPVVIVSNRLPISVKKIDGKLEFYASVGGLATGLSSYVSDKRNKWIGWPGIPSDDLSPADKQKITVELRKKNCYPVFLKQAQLDDYYNGYSNTILWPLFHDLPARTEEHDKYWKSYESVNASFAGVVLTLSDTKSTIWVHDYQLMTLPGLLRAVRPKAKIGFFLHIPFPSLKYYQQIKSGRELLLGMMGADLLGMHTRTYTDNFLKASAELTDKVIADNQIVHGAHVTRVTDFPMGIDYDRFTKARDLGSVKQELRKHRRKYKGMKVILTVDRLDPTKGLAERLEAYQEFLRRTPELHGKVVMAMLASPSRTDIDEYKRLRERVEGLVKDINTEFGTAKWTPVDYMYYSIPVEAVTALYQVADIAFITPLRDGMNLVAKEYVASKPKRDGVLILSSTAGAAQELTDALMVNPRKRDTMVDALTSAFKMPKRELKQRIATMHKHIATHTVQDWSEQFMTSLQKPIPGTRHLTRSLTPERTRELVAAFKQAERPAVILDYDGVLAPFFINPDDATPTVKVMKLLRKLGKHTGSQVAVVSGRSQLDLDHWLGELPISLVAEHGAHMRAAGKKNWKRLTKVSADWQDEIQPILERYAANTPGAHVEVKNFSLVWHYNGASAYYSRKHLVILRRLLRPIARRYDLSVNNGKNILEIKPEDVHKGAAVERLFRLNARGDAPDFILCIGDDYTDEDMFEQLPLSAYTVKVGRGLTAARLRVKSVDEVVKLLRKLTR